MIRCPKNDITCADFPYCFICTQIVVHRLLLQSRSEKRSIPFVPSPCGMARRRTLAKSPRALRSFTRVCRRCVLVCRVVATTLRRLRTTELQPSRWRNPLGGLGVHFCDFVPVVPDACDKDPTGAGRGSVAPSLKFVRQQFDGLRTLGFACAT